MVLTSQIFFLELPLSEGLSIRASPVPHPVQATYVIRMSIYVLIISSSKAK